MSYPSRFSFIESPDEFMAASAAYFWATNLADEDLWNHLNFGEQKLRTFTVPTIEASSYSAPGHPWFNHEWGAEVIFALCYRWGGTAALFALKIGAGVAIVAAMLAAARTLVRETDEAEAHPTLVAGVLLVSLSALARGASFRPQLFTMTGLAVEWWLLVRADARLFREGAVGRELVLVPLVVCAWTNLHGGFAVGVLVIIIYYMLNVACEFLVTTATVPPFAGAWLPNGIFALTTVVWFYVMSRR